MKTGRFVYHSDKEKSLVVRHSLRARCIAKAIETTIGLILRLHFTVWDKLYGFALYDFGVHLAFVYRGKILIDWSVGRLGRRYW